MIPSFLLLRVIPLSFVSLLFLPLSVNANPLDVPSNSWYARTVSSFADAGYIDETQPFRPTEKATRAEFIQLVVSLQGGVSNAPFTDQSFDDVAPNNPFFDFFEEAGLAGWLKGSDSCYGTHPCTAKPYAPINRAEAAALMIRAFSLQMSEEVPSFNDNPSGQWFTVPVNSAASLCILQGDAGGGRVRPADNLIRAEMVTMLARAVQHLNYPNCNIDGGISLPKYNSKSSSSSKSSESSIQQPKASSSSTSQLSPDTNTTLRILNFLAPSDVNLEAMKETYDHYHDSTHEPLYKQINDWIFRMKERIAKLNFLEKISESRGLTEAELEQVNTLMREINDIIDQFNKRMAIMTG